MQATIVRPVLFFLAAVGCVLGLCACDSASGDDAMNDSRGATGQEVVDQQVARMVVADAEQRRHLERATADVHIGNPQSVRVGTVLDKLVPIRRQFDSGAHYLLAAGSHLRDEGLLDEDFDLANKLSISTGDVITVLWSIKGAGPLEAVDEDALVREFYDGAEFDARTRMLLLRALKVMRAAIGELRDGDALIVIAS
jgi:hypothetical protein